MAKRSQDNFPKSNTPKPATNKGELKFKKWRLNKTTENIVIQNGKTYDQRPYHIRYVITHKSEDLFLNMSHPQFQQMRLNLVKQTPNFRNECHER